MRGYVIWLTGLSGSGKSTLAQAVGEKLKRGGISFTIIDGDDVRASYQNSLGLTESDIKKNNERIVDLCKNARLKFEIVLVAVISPYTLSREKARLELSPGFFEIYCNADLKSVMERDVKGLYAKAESGHIKEFTGKDSVFEEPTNCDLTIDTKECSIDECIEILYPQIIPQIYFTNRLK